MIMNKKFQFVVAASVAAMLSGCSGGGVSQNTVAQPPAGPVVYGLQPLDAVSGEYLETSGLRLAASVTPAIITGAVASTGEPLPAITVNGTIPLGFAPGALFIDGSSGVSVAPGASVVFRASLANGTNAKTRQVTPIVPSSVILTTSENPSFSQPLTFDSAGIGVGPLGNGQYTTGAFTLPFTTTGLHSFTVSVADSSGQSSTTTFDEVVTAANAGAVLVSIVDGTNSPIPGATATITNAISGATTQSTADNQGVVILFASPGVQTVTITPPSGPPVTAQVTIVGGQATVSAQGGGPLTITG